MSRSLEMLRGIRQPSVFKAETLASGAIIRQQVYFVKQGRRHLLNTSCTQVSLMNLAVSVSTVLILNEIPSANNCQRLDEY